MRMRVLALTALIGCGALAARADEPAVNKTDPAITAQPSVPAPEPASPPKAAPPIAGAAKPAAESKADKQPAAPAGARYGFERVGGGYLRFDYQTGHISYCTPQSETWGCQAVPDARSAIQKEVERLRSEIAELKSKLEGMQHAPHLQDVPPRPPQPIPPETKPTAPNLGSGSGDMTFSVPAREHIARAASAVQNAWEQFVEMVTALKNDVLRRAGA